MKKISILSTALFLSACAGPEGQSADMEAASARLPEGCELKYAGSVRVAGSLHESRIFYVDCNNTRTISETNIVTSGKSSVPVNTVTVIQK